MKVIKVKKKIDIVLNLGHKMIGKEEKKGEKNIMKNIGLKILVCGSSGGLMDVK